MSGAQMSGAQKLGAQYSRAQNSALRIPVSLHSRFLHFFLFHYRSFCGGEIGASCLYGGTRGGESDRKDEAGHGLSRASLPGSAVYETRPAPSRRPSV